jgi:hypothetical protein
MTVKLPCFRNHPADAGGIVHEQSAILQLQKRKELHHEKEKRDFVLPNLKNGCILMKTNNSSQQDICNLSGTRYAQFEWFLH